MKTINLTEHIIVPEGESRPCKLQYVAQDLYDLQSLEMELEALHERIEDSTGELAVNLCLALDAVSLARGALSRALCLLTEWAPKVGVPTSVEIDDTPKKFVEAVEAPNESVEEVLLQTTREVGGKN